MGGVRGRNAGQVVGGASAARVWRTRRAKHGPSLAARLTAAVVSALVVASLATVVSPSGGVSSHRASSPRPLHHLKLASASSGPGWGLAPISNLFSPGTTNEPYSVTCVSASDCWAVGSTAPANSAPSAFALNWNGTWWSQSTLPSLGSGVELTSVNCVSASNCWAVGFSGLGSQTGEQLLTLNWNGSSWTQTTTPNPTSGTLDFDASSVLLPAIACADSSDCWVVGGYVGSGAPQDFALGWNGTAWSVSSVPAASTPYDSTTLGGVTCTSASNCWAVGTESSSTGSPGPQAFIVQWNGTSWGTVSAATSSGLSSISCSSSSACWAVGPGLAGTGTTGTMQQWNGIAWSVVTLPSASAALSAIACGSSTNCWAVGQGTTTSSTSTNIGFQWNGSTWSSDPLPQPLPIATPLSIACAGSNCWAMSAASNRSISRAFADYTTGQSGTPPLAGGGVPLAAQGGALVSNYGGGSTLQSGGTTAQAGVVDPVNTATGDNYETTVDLSIPGAGIPLTFTRTYDSQAAQAEVNGGLAPGPLGYGWYSNLGESLSYNALSQVVTLTEGNGAQDTFNAYSPSTSPPWCSGSTNFCAASPRTIATLNQNADGSSTLVNDISGQMTYTFSSSGILTAIADAQGDSLTSSTGTPGTGQCPSSSSSCTVWTSSASGRTLTLAFNASGQMTQAADPAGNAVTYCFYTQACASGAPSGGGQANDLYQATMPGSLVTSYTYDASNSNSSLQHDLLTVTPPGMGEEVNTYDSSGRVTQQQNMGSGEVTTFSYTGNSLSLNGGSTTVKTYPQGTGTGKPDQVDLYTYSDGVQLSKITTNSATSAQTTQLTERDPVSLAPIGTQDANGNVTSDTLNTYSTGGNSLTSADVLLSSDAVGNSEQSAYNSFNQPWCQVDAADYDNGARCPGSPPSAPPVPGQTDPNLGITISFYNSSDQLTAKTDALGNTTTYAYTSSVSGVPNGLMYCSVDPVDYQASVTCPAYGASHVIGTSTHTFDSAGDTLSATDADGNTTTNVYNASGHPGLVSSTTDPDGTVTSYTYNSAGQVLNQTVSFGSYSASTLYAYDSSGRKYCEVDPLESRLGVTCPTSPPSPTSPPANVASTFYDANGRVIQTTNPIGGTTISAFDGAGNKYCTVAPYAYANGVRCPSSPPSTPPTPSNDPYAGATIDTYNALEQLSQDTNPLGGITLYTYDAAGNKIEQDVESNDVTHDPTVTTTFGYDVDNRVISTTVDPGSSLAATTLQSYDPNGNVYCTVSANAYAAGPSSYQCPGWQPAWITNPPSPTSLYSSTPNSSQANDVSITFSNANGNEVQATNPDVQTNVTSVDADGRTYCTSDATNVASWLTANPSGTYPYLCPTSPPSTPPAQGSNPGYMITIFDAAGQTLSSTDQLGDTTSYTYDAAGHKLTMVDPRGKTTTYCYYGQNASGQCASGAQSGGGSADDLYSQTTPPTSSDPNGELTTYTYLPGDKASLTTTPAGTTQDVYDAAGNFISHTYSNTASGYLPPTPIINSSGSTVTYSYFADGSRASMTDATGTTTYSYDNNKDLTQQQFTPSVISGLAAATTSYTYFSTGAKGTVTYPANAVYSNPKVTYAYDGTGAMISETDFAGNVVTFSHDADGNPTGQSNAVSQSNPSGTSSTTWSYDAADQNSQASSTVTQTCSQNSATINQYFSGTNGSRNADGQLTQASVQYQNSCSGYTNHQRNYSYDLAGRVVYEGSAPQGANANNFAYDPSGDLTQISQQGSAQSYSQSFDSAGEVQSQTPLWGSGTYSSTYSFDSLGDQAAASSSGPQGGSTVYDQLGRTTEVSQSLGATYSYNGDGLNAGIINRAGSLFAWKNSVSIGATGIKSSSCPTSTFCAAVNTYGNAIMFGVQWSGGQPIWSAPQNIDGSLHLNAVSCISFYYCLAGDSSGNVLTWNGSSWSAKQKVDGSRSIKAVSCVPSRCVVVDSSGDTTTYLNGTWSTPINIDSHALTAVSCETVSSCIAGDSAGNILRFNGSSWSGAVFIDYFQIDSLSCLSSNFCMAADNYGQEISTTNNFQTSTAVRIDGTSVMESVSCNSGQFCMTVDNAGHVYWFNGLNWLNTLNVQGGPDFAGVSCPTVTFCDAITGAGNSFVYAPPATQFVWDACGCGALAHLLSDGTNDYIYGPFDTPVEQLNIQAQGTSPTFMTFTAADSAWLFANLAGNQVSFETYDAFGTLSNLDGSSSVSQFGYAGQYQDTATGFYDMRARWYNENTGAFTTRDPAFSRTDEAFAYATGDPVNSIDPMGLERVKHKKVRFARSGAGHQPGHRQGLDSEISCDMAIDWPHPSNHVPGTANVEANVKCTAPMSLIALNISLYVYFFLAGQNLFWGQPPLFMQAEGNAAAQCFNGIPYVGSATQVLVPPPGFNPPVFSGTIYSDIRPMVGC